MNRTKSPALKAARCYNRLAHHADNGRKFRPLAWSHTATRLEIAAKTSSPLYAQHLRWLAADARERATAARKERS